MERVRLFKSSSATPRSPLLPWQHKCTSENSVKRKFAQFTFHELRRCRSELHTSRGRRRKVGSSSPREGSTHP